MNIIFITIIVLGVLFDLTDFTRCAILCLKRKKVPSSTLIVGFVVQAAGLYGLAQYKIITWKYFFILLGLALLLHLFIHIILPLPFTMICNLYYGRKLLDMSDLPPLRKDISKTKGDNLNTKSQ
jgi:hypothetical protein